MAAIIKAENIEVTDEDVEAEYKKLAEQYNMDLETVKKYLPADQTKEQLANQKAVEVVMESATATKPEKKKPAKKDEAEAEGEEKPAKKPAAKKSAKKDEAEAEGEEKPAKKPAAKKSSKKAEKEAE